MGPESASGVSRRRRWKAVVIGTVVLVALPAGWLATHLVPRTGYFADRAAAVAAVVAGPETPEPGNFVSQPIQVTTGSGLVVNFRILRPAGAAAPLPLVVMLGGQRTGRDAVDVVGDPGAMAVAALDYPYHGKERISGLYQSLASIPAIQRGLLDTPPAVTAALDWLVQQPWVDPERIELMGLSLGVPFATVAGARDPRFRRVWLVHGQIENRAWIANRLEERISNRWLREPAAWLVHLLAHGATFRTDRWIARIAPRQVVVIGATEDEQMSRASVEALYHAAAEPKELLWSQGPHVRPRRHDVVRQLLSMVRSRIEGTVAADEDGSGGAAAPPF